MKSLFPEIEADYQSWILKRLQFGEAFDVSLYMEFAELLESLEADPSCHMKFMRTLESMWICGHLARRKSPSWHPCGEVTHFYRKTKRKP